VADVDIDLGVLEPVRDADVPQGDLLHEPPPSPRARPVAALFATGALVLSLVGAVERPGLTPVATVSAAPVEFAVDADTVYALSADQVATYGTAGETGTWPLGSRRFRDVAVVGDAVVVSGGECPGVVGSTVAVFDRRGDQRWRRSGRLMGGVAGRPWVVVERPATGQRCTNSGPASITAATIQAVDTRTGATAWSFERPATAAAYGVTDNQGDLTGVVTVSTDGTAQVRRTVDGRAHADGRIAGLRRSTTGRGLFASQVFASGGTIVVADGRSNELLGYAVGTLEQRWRLRAPEGGRRALPVTYFGCGTLICSWANSETLAAVTPRVPANVPRSWLGQVNQVLVVVDPERGQVVRHLGGYQLLGADADALLLSWPTTAGGTSLAWFSPRTAEMRMLASSHERYNACVVGQRRLACTTSDNGLRIWRTRG